METSNEGKTMRTLTMLLASECIDQSMLYLYLTADEKNHAQVGRESAAPEDAKDPIVKATRPQGR